VRVVVDHVSKTYTVRGQDAVTALSEVDVTVDSQELVALVGPSGCGKSTLLNILAGLLAPSTGAVFFEGTLGAGRPATAMVFQEFALFPWRTVQGNVEFGLEELSVGADERSRRARHYVEMMGLAGFETRYPHQLSGGMRQRVGIARALAVDPAVLLMDEPFSALDAQTRQLMQEELLTIWERTRQTIVYVTHNIHEAVYMADRVVVLSRRPGPGVRRGRRAHLGPHQGPGAGGPARVTTPARIPVEDRTRFLRRPDHRLLRVGALLGLLALWEALARLGWVPVLFLPSPVGVLHEGWDMLVSGEIALHVAASLRRLALGFLVGGVLGVVVGVAIGFFAIAEAVGMPLVAATFPIPKIALLPLLILWLGIGETSKVAVIALGVFFPMAINTYTGVRQADPLLVRAAVAFGARRWSVIRKVVLPSALPMIFAGLRLGAGTALLLLVAAEMIAVESGIGFLVLHAGNLMATTKLMVGIVLLSLLGVLAHWGLGALERLAIPWRAG